VQHYLRPLEGATQYGPAEVFLDWEALSGYDSECRRQMTDFVLANRSRFARVHVLVRNRLVAMGVTTAGLLIGGGIVTAYAERGAFEVLLQRVLDAQRHDSADNGGRLH